MNTITVNATTWGGTLLYLFTLIVNLAAIALCLYAVVLFIGLL